MKNHPVKGPMSGRNERQLLMTLPKGDVCTGIATRYLLPLFPDAQAGLCFISQRKETLRQPSPPHCEPQHWPQPSSSPSARSSSPADHAAILLQDQAQPRPFSQCPDPGVLLITVTDWKGLRSPPPPPPPAHQHCCCGPGRCQASLPALLSSGLCSQHGPVKT